MGPRRTGRSGQPEYLTLVALATLGVALAGCRGSEAPPPAARVVLVQAAAPATAIHAVFNGEVRAHEIDLAFRVGGKMAARLVDTGTSVSAGQGFGPPRPRRSATGCACPARAQLSAAESDYATARSERERQAGLLARKFVSQAAFDARIMPTTLPEVGWPRRVPKRDQRQPGRYGTLNSEHAGIVTAVLAEAGQVVAAGQPVMRLARPEEKEVAIAVPESRVAELRAAKQIAIQAWAQPDALLRGTLRNELSPAADASTRTYAARIRIIDAPASLGLGMTARVLLDATPGQQLLVPLSDRIDAGHGPLVRVVNDGKVASRPVSIARFREDGAEIASGLQAGEAVVVTGAGRLVDGEAVQTRAVTPADRQR